MDVDFKTHLSDYHQQLMLTAKCTGARNDLPTDSESLKKMKRLFDGIGGAKFFQGEILGGLGWFLFIEPGTPKVRS